MKTIIAVTLFLILANGRFLFAEDVSATPKTSLSTSATESISETSDTLYLDFKGATLLNVLFVISKLTGINFVAGKEIASREVNMVLDNVTLDDALDALARGCNIAYEFIATRNLYLFRASSDKPEEPPMITRVFKLYYVRVAELREIDVSGSGGGGGSSGGGSASVAALSESKTSGESSTPVMKIVKNILSSRGRVDMDDRSNSLVVTDSEDRLRMVEQAIVALDRQVDQVLISAILIETKENFGSNFGLTWTSSTTGTMATMTPGSTTSEFPFNTEFHKWFNINAEKYGTTRPATTYGTLSFANMQMNFNALETAEKLKVLAKPRILVLDNHPAVIKITTNSTIGKNTVSTTIGSQDAGQSVDTAERTETGTMMRVTPLINTDGKITMTIEPQYITQATTTLITNTADPTTRAARTTMMVNNGQTVVLGGLLSSQQVTGKQKVPFLSDVPGIGEIFTKRTKTYEDRELILFVTPFIIRDPSELQAFSVPDERERFDDAKAPFWKVKRKEWFKKLEDEKKTSDEQAVEDMDQRDKLMDEAVKKLETNAKQTASPSKTSLVSSTKTL